MHCSFSGRRFSFSVATGWLAEQGALAGNKGCYDNLLVFRTIVTSFGLLGKLTCGRILTS